MKLISLLFALLMVSTSWAAEVDGQLFYKKSDDNIARRDVTLDVPSMGKGEVVLKGKGFEWRTNEFWSTYAANGEIVFTAVFQSNFMGKTTIALEGTYLKGENEIIYNGNVYKKDGHAPVNGNISDFEYNGGFTFNYQR